MSDVINFPIVVGNVIGYCDDSHIKRCIFLHEGTDARVQTAIDVADRMDQGGKLQARDQGRDSSLTSF
jgi:hypothetical protein